MAGASVEQLINRIRKHPLKWRYADNLVPTLAYRLGSKPPLTAEGTRVLDELNQTGIAITSAQALLGYESYYSELKQTIGTLGEELSEEIAVARARAADPDIQKAFKISYVVGRRKLHADDVFVRFALQRPIVQVANAYFGMLTHLRFINVWHTFATQSPPRDSQLWHRDRDDHHIIKVFVYLSDVDEDSGPFTYAPCSHPKGVVRDEARHRIERVDGPRRTVDADMNEIVPRERWVKATGPAGTIVFADTRGYHCGGRARKRDRIMYIGMFASSASAKPADGLFEHACAKQSLTREQAFAISV